MPNWDVGLDEWSSVVVSQCIDSNCQPSPYVIRQQKWSAIVVGDAMNWMEAEWLADAIRIASPNPVCGVGFEYHAKPDVAILSPSSTTIMEYNFLNISRYALITSKDVEYLYYKDHANRFFVLCGSNSFLACGYKCSWDTAKKMYFDYWVDLEHNTTDEKRFLKSVWDKYAIFRPAAG